MLNKDDALEIITKKSKSGSTYKTYIFNCDCGRKVKSQSSQLKTHSGKCRRCTQLGKPYMYIYNELMNHRNSKVGFTLTYDELVYIIENNKGCNYCGSNLDYKKHSKEWGKDNSRAHHLDRKDNKLGYTFTNVVTCCWECNRLKSDRFTYEEFMLLSPILKKIMNERI